jgi:hypothetical protein
MHDAPPILIALEKLVSHWLHVVGNGIEVFGVLVIVIGDRMVNVSVPEKADGRASL